jgi:hypothetical protein
MHCSLIEWHKTDSFNDATLGKVNGETECFQYGAAGVYGDRAWNDVGRIEATDIQQLRLTTISINLSWFVQPFTESFLTGYCIPGSHNPLIRDYENPVSLSSFKFP